jgi:hypothetical protein
VVHRAGLDVRDGSNGYVDWSLVGRSANLTTFGHTITVEAQRDGTAVIEVDGEPVGSVAWNG